MPAELLVRCVHGVEWVVAGEIEASVPDARDITIARRELRFTLPGLDPRVLGLRCADDVFLQVGQLDGVGPAKADLAALTRTIARLEWTSALGAVTALRASPTAGPTAGTASTASPTAGTAVRTFDCVVSIEGKRSYNRFDAENAIGEALSGVLGLRFLPRSPHGLITGPPDGATAWPEVTVRLFLRGPAAIATLRVARRPLHRRSYKLATGPGTLHPPLAAALATIAGTGGMTMHDPFCGDGTLAIEAALIWPTARVSASDIDPARVASTRANAARAGVQITCSTGDAADLPRIQPEASLLLTNPPWERTVTSHGSIQSSLEQFWRLAATVLGEPGRLCTVTDAALDVPRTLRQHRYAIGLATRLRLAGRIVHISVAAPPPSPPPQLPSGLAQWRHQALAGNVITEHGF